MNLFSLRMDDSLGSKLGRVFTIFFDFDFSDPNAVAGIFTDHGVELRV